MNSTIMDIQKFMWTGPTITENGLPPIRRATKGVSTPEQQDCAQATPKGHGVGLWLEVMGVWGLELRVWTLSVVNTESQTMAICLAAWLGSQPLTASPLQGI